MKKLALVHASGVSAISSATRAVGVGVGAGIGIGVGRARTDGVQITNLADAVRAPEPQAVHPLAYVGLILGALFALVSGLPVLTGDFSGIAVLVGSIAVMAVIRHYIRSTRRYNVDVYQPARAKWDRSFLCERCAHVFEFVG